MKGGGAVKKDKYQKFITFKIAKIKRYFKNC